MTLSQSNYHDNNNLPVAGTGKAASPPELQAKPNTKSAFLRWRARRSTDNTSGGLDFNPNGKFPSIVCKTASKFKIFIKSETI